MKTTTLFAFSIISLSALSANAFNAVYSVPVKDAPEAAANQTVAEITTALSGETTLTYKLPVDLVGKYDKPVVLTLESKVVTPTGVIAKFKDQIGWTLCMTQTSGLSCTGEYDQLKFDADEVHEVLTDKYSSNPPLLAAKLRAAQSFSTDPIGILQINCPSANCGL